MRGVRIKKRVREVRDDNFDLRAGPADPVQFRHESHEVVDVLERVPGMDGIDRVVGNLVQGFVQVGDDIDAGQFDQVDAEIPFQMRFPGPQVQLDLRVRAERLQDNLVNYFQFAFLRLDPQARLARRSYVLQSRAG